MYLNLANIKICNGTCPGVGKVDICCSEVVFKARCWWSVVSGGPKGRRVLYTFLLCFCCCVFLTLLKPSTGFVLVFLFLLILLPLLSPFLLTLSVPVCFLAYGRHRDISVLHGSFVTSIRRSKSACRLLKEAAGWTGQQTVLLVTVQFTPS